MTKNSICCWKKPIGDLAGQPFFDFFGNRFAGFVSIDCSDLPKAREY